MRIDQPNVAASIDLESYSEVLILRAICAAAQPEHVLQAAREACGVVPSIDAIERVVSKVCSELRVS